MAPNRQFVERTSQHMECALPHWMNLFGSLVHTSEHGDVLHGDPHGIRVMKQTWSRTNNESILDEPLWPLGEYRVRRFARIRFSNVC